MKISDNVFHIQVMQRMCLLSRDFNFHDWNVAMHHHGSSMCDTFHLKRIQFHEFTNLYESNNKFAIKIRKCNDTRVLLKKIITWVCRSIYMVVDLVTKEHSCHGIFLFLDFNLHYLIILFLHIVAQ